MSTALGSFDDFWAASRPFFERIRRDPKIVRGHRDDPNDLAMLRIREALELTAQQTRVTDAHLDVVASTVAALAEAVAKQAARIEAQERRLAGTESS